MKLIISKALASFLVLAMIFGALFVSLGKTDKASALYEGEEDASCLETLDSYWYFTSWRVLHQWWRPKHNQINEFWMYVDSTGGGTFNLDIDQWLEPQASIVNDQIATATGQTQGWVGFDFPNKAVTNGDLYWASVTGSYPNRWWFHKTDDCWEQNMTQGVTAYGSLTFYYDYDFIFWVYGQDAGVPPAEGDPPGDTPPGDTPPSEDPGGVATGSDQPTTTSDTVASINPPTEVTAIDVPDDEGGALKVTWKESGSSGLSGYRIFRSTEEDGKYLRVGSVKSTATEYADSGLETGKTYYYLVRAYNSKGESKDSNKVSASPTDNLAPASVKNFKAEYDTVDKAINLSWDVNTEIDLDGYTIKYGTSEDKLDNTIEAKKEAVKYQLLDIEGSKTYYFTISAKDTHGNIGSPAKTNIATPKEAGASWKDEIFTLPNYIGASLILLLIATFVILTIRRRRKMKLSPPSPSSVSSPPATPSTKS
jgi:hypothetical protein